MKNTLRLAADEDVNTVVDFLMAMQSELKELSIEPDVARQAVKQSLRENVYWFIFHDENQQPFGVCHLQSIHNYWRLEKRFYLGGFYIAHTHRRQGRFKELYDLIKHWVISQNGVQIYTHIHRHNKRSIEKFMSVDMEEIEYRLFVDHWGD